MHLLVSDAWTYEHKHTTYERRGNKLPLQNLLFMHHHNHYSYRRFMPFLFRVACLEFFFSADAEVVVYHTFYGCCVIIILLIITLFSKCIPSWGPTDVRRQTLFSHCFIFAICILFCKTKESAQLKNRWNGTSSKWGVDEPKTFLFFFMKYWIYSWFCANFVFCFGRLFSFDLNEDWRRLQNVNLSLKSLWLTAMLNLCCVKLNQMFYEMTRSRNRNPLKLESLLLLLRTYYHCKHVLRLRDCVQSWPTNSQLTTSSIVK